MRLRIRRRLLIGGIACLVAPGLTSVALLSAPSAGAASRGGVIYAYGTPALSGPDGTIVIAGAVGDYGPTIKVDRAGHTDPTGTFGKLVLQRGTIMINNTALQRAIQAGSRHAHLNPATCSLHGTISAPSKIVSGTGAYAHITGTIKVTFTMAELVGRLAGGGCNTKAGPIAVYASIFGTGTVRFG